MTVGSIGLHADHLPGAPHSPHDVTPHPLTVPRQLITKEIV